MKLRILSSRTLPELVKEANNLEITKDSIVGFDKTSEGYYILIYYK